jgi:hypothetical protein
MVATPVLETGAERRGGSTPSTPTLHAPLAELVDALASNPSAERRAGSSPAGGTGGCLELVYSTDLKSDEPFGVGSSSLPSPTSNTNGEENEQTNMLATADLSWSCSTMVVRRLYTPLALDRSVILVRFQAGLH